MLILVCNAGSTSLKYKLFNMPDEKILVEAKVERVGRNDAIFSYTNHVNNRTVKLEQQSVPDYSAGISLFLRYLLDPETGYLRDISQLEAVGFKTVLAKGYYGVHELTEDVIAGMEAYISVAPAHNPPYIQAIREFKALLPDKLMVGCFETAFHTTIPQERRLYALPYEWAEQYGIQRYGYHGASHGYISRQVRKLAGAHYRLISCHMGGSGSICAILDGKSVDTSFGFSLQTGIPHANRCGDMDAYIIPYLLGQGMPLEKIMEGIDKKGGLLGISGVSNDLRDIENAAQQGNPRAGLAIDMFCNAVVKYIGAFYAELGGLDYLVFTGGIGENSAVVREKICSAIPHLGIDFDREKNNPPANSTPPTNTGTAPAPADAAPATDSSSETGSTPAPADAAPATDSSSETGSTPVSTNTGTAPARANTAAVPGLRELTRPGSPVKVLVLPTNEEVGIAQTIYETYA